MTVAGTLAFTLAAAGALGFMELDRYVDSLILADTARPTFYFVDLPEPLPALAGVDLETAVHDINEQLWLSASVCEEIAKRLERTGWIAGLRHVRRLAGGRFEIRANYRRPAALVQKGSDFYLVDWEGVRLPGIYMHHPMWKLIQGVAAAPPPPGEKWASDDLRAGLDVLAALRGELFAEQVSAVLVNNHRGRSDPRSAHVELGTDRPGGRILWGSAPGAEVEENAAAQKLTILRENHRRTGRVDAGYLVIDVSTFPDRFTVPG